MEDSQSHRPSSFVYDGRSLMRSRLFWIISRVAVSVYRRFPVFGRLRGTVAIIQRESKYVVVKRSDGYGTCFPGGLLWPWESEEAGIRREVHEETGLTVSGLEFKFRFQSYALYPTRTTVFVADAEGSLESSWEGSVGLLQLEELDGQIMPTQRAVVEYLKSGEIPI